MRHSKTLRARPPQPINRVDHLGLQETEGVLAAERARAQKLQESVARLQDENDEFSRKVTELSETNKSLADKSREQVRALILWIHFL